jgi:hypothetical protein
MGFAKCFRKSLPSLGLGLALALIWSVGCAPRLAPLAPPGLTMQPGRYLTAFYRAPDFDPGRVTYTLEPFTVGQAQAVSPETFQAMLQEELTRAWQANGLKTSPRGEVVLSGTIQYVALRGTSIRFITGKICTDLVVSGALARGDETLFAFQDRIHLTSPVKPGPPAPKEAELLLRDTARTLAMHLLNELLLYGLPAAGM